MKNIELFADHFQNYKKYGIPKAQLIIADIPFNLGIDAYGSNPKWYNSGDRTFGESKLAKKPFFNTDFRFNIFEFFHFTSRMLKKDGKEKGTAPCMLVFCSFEQQFILIEAAKKNGFDHYINLVFRKKTSPQVLKANMRIVGNCEYGLLFYRDMLPKFNNNGKMIYNCFEMRKDKDVKIIHPTQKPVNLLEKIIEIFTDKGDVVIDPVAGSGTTLAAAAGLDRRAYGFEIVKEYRDGFEKHIKSCIQKKMFI